MLILQYLPPLFSLHLWDFRECPHPVHREISIVYCSREDGHFGCNPNQGPEGTPITISGKDLPANATLPLTWSTADGAWIVDVQPNTVNYMGVKYIKYSVDMVTVTTDASGAFTYKTKIPRDFGGVHDIYMVKDGAAIAHGGFQMNPTLSISPKSGPIGTRSPLPIQVWVQISTQAASLFCGIIVPLVKPWLSGHVELQYSRYAQLDQSGHTMWR